MPAIDLGCFQRLTRGGRGRGGTHTLHAGRGEMRSRGCACTLSALAAGKGARANGCQGFPRPRRVMEIRLYI
jgi:hypothetical protein